MALLMSCMRNAPSTAPSAEPRPPESAGAVLSKERSALADLGIQYLTRALELRPAYPDALVYLGLLYRQKSFAYFDQPSEWQAAVDSAESFRKKATSLQAAPPPASP